MHNNQTILVVAAHPDDEVLGCGGSVSRYAEEGYDVHLLIMADGESSRADEGGLIALELLTARKIAAKKACKILGCSSVTILNLPDNRLDSLDRLDIIKKIESFISKYQPITVFTHHVGDVNIDHRIVHDAVVTACRSQPVHPVRELLFFEVPSSTEWCPTGSMEIFHPNVYIEISRTMQKKKDALNAYNSEIRPFPHPRSFEAIEALAKWRGATVGVNAAEAFVLGRKVV